MPHTLYPASPGDSENRKASLYAEMGHGLWSAYLYTVNDKEISLSCLSHHGLGPPHITV